MNCCYDSPSKVEWSKLIISLLLQDKSLTEFGPVCFQTYSREHMEPLSDYHADNSRSDLSDILEEEEEDLYSDHLCEKQGRSYTVGAHRVKKLFCSHMWCLWCFCCKFSFNGFVLSKIFVSMCDWVFCCLLFSSLTSLFWLFCLHLPYVTEYREW